MDTTQIIDAVSKCTGVSKEQILSRQRTRKVVFARHLCMFFIHKLTDETLTSIGKILNSKRVFNHTTVIHGLRIVNDMIYIKDDPTLSIIAFISKELNLSPDECSVRQKISSIATMLNDLPLYIIEPCRTFGELAEQLNKRISA